MFKTFITWRSGNAKATYCVIDLDYSKPVDVVLYRRIDGKWKQTVTIAADCAYGIEDILIEWTRGRLDKRVPALRNSSIVY